MIIENPNAINVCLNPPTNYITITFSKDVNYSSEFMIGETYYGIKETFTIKANEKLKIYFKDSLKSCKRLFCFSSDSNVYFINSIDLSHFNLSNITNMDYMFYYVKSLESLDLSYLETSKVTSMSCMFEGFESLKSLDLSNFNTKSV